MSELGKAMVYLAHSPPKNNPELPPHTYTQHVMEVLRYGLSLFDYLLFFTTFSNDEKEKLRQTLKAALMLHDIGKLDEENQRVLCRVDKGRLKVDHIDAGTALAAEMKNELLGWLIRGHHAPGLPSKKTEKYFIKQLKSKFKLSLSPYCLRGARHGRDKLTADWSKHYNTIVLTNSRLDIYKQCQMESCGHWPKIDCKLPEKNLVTRIMLSCLVDADHGSAASYSQNQTMTIFQPVDPCWGKRLQALDNYIAGLAASSSKLEGERNQMRGAFYDYCRKVELYDSRLVSCSAPVGLGKTTSVMAYLLRCAMRDGLNRIFIVAPFSNIIDQTVQVLRNAVVLDGENPETTVVAHHHKADFSSKEMRQYTASWQAPIVVTTAVQFFETMASSMPAKLRKLHNVVGSAIFIDESHACLPPELLNISWHWMKDLVDNWGCHIVFSSGSMVEFWQDDYLVEQPIDSLPDLFPSSLQVKVKKMESHRVLYEKIEQVLSRDELVERILSDETWQDYLHKDKPSCLIILNTVQSAAVIAETLASKLDDKVNTLKNKAVLHLSTALAPKDRNKILNEIMRRQKESDWNKRPWFLVATSCVEAGVDLDFAVAFRETCSVTSFLQVSGRINRHGKRVVGKLYDFSILAEDGLTHHPNLKESSDIFRELWPQLISMEDNNKLCSMAIRKELSRFPSKKNRSEQLLADEKIQNFQKISSEYRVIDSETATVIIAKDIVEKLKIEIPVSWQTIQENSVQLWTKKIKKLQLMEIPGCQQDEIYSWVDSYEYDPDFLGIMKGLLEQKILFEQLGGII